VSSEGRLGLALRARQRRLQLVFAVDEPHAAPAAAGGGLQHHRVADARRGHLGVDRVRKAAPVEAAVARDHRNTGRLHARARRRLDPHRAHRRRRRADEGGAGRVDRLGKIGVLRQKAVTGMNAVGAALADGIDELLDDQVALARGRRTDGDRLVGQAHVGRQRVGFGIDGHRAQAELAAGANHPAGDLAAVGDQHLGDLAGRHQ
jgi:hypothetical protein